MKDIAYPKSVRAQEATGDAAGGAAASRDVSPPAGAMRKGPATSRKDALDPRKDALDRGKDALAKAASARSNALASKTDGNAALSSAFVPKPKKGARTDAERETKPEIVIKQGSYGTGAFVGPKENIATHTYLGEYVAEMCPLPTGPEGERYTVAERMVNKHRKLNYMMKEPRNDEGDEFTLFDAATVGNATRCLNDSLVDKAKLNVFFCAFTVDGDRRIGLWTTQTVRRGEELLLDYGTGYWADDDERVDTESTTLADDHQQEDKIRRVELHSVR
ncbi:hypothetical protein C8T65DRAFT_742701 [Cerioporus squamosus]|nr:hypothetical protein C8T65DRAFT_742701 [Cerioporus squamosus]